jgi:hypothetical protein
MRIKTRLTDAGFTARLGRLNRLVQFTLCCAQMLFRLSAMSLHIVVVGCADGFHLMDRVFQVLTDRLQVVPVTNLRNCDSRDKPTNDRHTRKNGNCKIRELGLP